MHSGFQHASVSDRTPRLLIVGGGDLAAKVMVSLCWSGPAARIHVISRGGERLLRAVNTAVLSSRQMGKFPEISYSALDLGDLDRVAQVIADFKPDLVFNTASLQAWHKVSELPSHKREAISEANLGAWTAMHLAPVYRLMMAVRESGSRAVTVNAAYPDVVHPVLNTVGLSPDFGIGNVANSVPALTSEVARICGVRYQDIETRFVAHHYVSYRLSRFGDAGEGDFLLDFRLKDGRTVDFPPAQDLFAACASDYRRVGGRDGQVMTAASALSVIKPLLTGEDALVHSPGWHGLPGGYPVLLTNGSSRLSLPLGASDTDALRVNLAGQRADGVADISPAGTVTLTSKAADVMASELGFACSSFSLAQVGEVAQSLGDAYEAYCAAAGLR